MKILDSKFNKYDKIYMCDCCKTKFEISKNDIKIEHYAVEAEDCFNRYISCPICSNRINLKYIK